MRRGSAVSNSMLSSEKANFIYYLESSNYTGPMVAVTMNSKICLSFMMYFTFCFIDPKCVDMSTTSNPAVYPLGMIYFLRYDRANSSRSRCSRTDILVLYSFLTKNVLVTLDLMYIWPKSIITGPESIFYSISGDSSIVVSLISVWVLGSWGNFLRTIWFGSGLKPFLTFPSIYFSAFMGS